MMSSSGKEWKSESDYYKKLSDDDKKQYKKKLTLSNGKLVPDPYSIKNGWNDDVSKLPDVGWPDIYTYLIETPSEFTKDKLKAYKSLEAYNFFVSGHVHDVFYNDIAESFCCIKTTVLPSQRQGKKDKLYAVWIVMSLDGWILCANCDCMSGCVKKITFLKFLVTS